VIELLCLPAECSAQLGDTKDPLLGGVGPTHDKQSRQNVEEDLADPRRHGVHTTEPWCGSTETESVR